MNMVANAVCPAHGGRTLGAVAFWASAAGATGAAGATTMIVVFCIVAGLGLVGKLIAPTSSLSLLSHI